MSDKIISEKLRLFKAFPEELRQDVEKVVAILPWDDHQTVWQGQTLTTKNFIGLDEVDIILEGKPVTIPYRVYLKEPLRSDECLLTEVQKDILNCIYLLHNDGFVRQKRLQKVLDKPDYFITPYLFCLLGGYVVEILEILEKHISPQTIGNYIKFIRENESFWHKTESRIISYWSVYYRKQFPEISNYVGGRILTKLKIEVARPPRS